MTPWLISIFVAGFVGSLHCVGMCGPLVLVAGGCSGVRRSVPLYQTGRLLAYVALGALAGSLGMALDLGAGRLLGVGHIATVIASATMVVVGLIGVARYFGWIRTAPSAAAWTTRLVKLGGPRRRAFGLGSLSALMPCGLLYSFALVAAGLADPVRGGLALAAFWLGTLPALLLVAIVGRRATRRAGRWAPLLVAVVLVATGIFGLAHRAGIDVDAGTCCDHGKHR